MNQKETIEFAKKYLEDIMTFFDLNLVVDVELVDDAVVATIPSNERNSLLIGKGAETLQALQALLSAAIRNKSADFFRVRVDIAGYKKQHAEKIVEKAKVWIDDVRETGLPKSLHLSPADRWTVHNFAAEFSDITTHSEGEGRDRRLIISQKSP